MPETVSPLSRTGLREDVTMLPLSECDVRALRCALEHEYRGFALHDRLAGDFGPAPRLDHIRDIESAHIETLEVLHKRFRIPVPGKPRHLHIHRFRDAVHACAFAIEAEREHLAVYRLLIETARDACVLAELRNLERECRDGRLPALRAWRRELRKLRRGRADPRSVPARRRTSRGSGRWLTGTRQSDATLRR
jgi:hypothetical protein